MPSTPKRRMTDYFSSPKVAKVSPIPLKALFDVNLSPQTPKRRKVSIDGGDEGQYVLDAGQKLIGKQYCSKCEMVYSIDSSRDVDAHNRHHNMTTDIDYFKVTSKQIEAWKKKVPVSISNDGDRLVFYLKHDTECSLKKRVETIIEEVVNVSFGFSPDLTIWGRDNRCTIWVAISQREGARFISSIMVSEMLADAQFADTGETFRINTGIVGVNRVWTHPLAQRQGIAKQLVTLAMRRNYTKFFALSDPTDAGKQLALSLTNHGDKRYLIYSLSK